eukprot:scaffold38722_cov21-Tisochrysis_lutea.AAC.1
MGASQTAQATRLFFLFWCGPAGCELNLGLKWDGAGRVEVWQPPSESSEFKTPADGHNFIRVDSGIEGGDLVGTHYDPMIAKIIVHGSDRHNALATLRKALEQTKSPYLSFGGPSQNFPGQRNEQKVTCLLIKLTFNNNDNNNNNNNNNKIDDEDDDDNCTVASTMIAVVAEAQDGWRQKNRQAQHIGVLVNSYWPMPLYLCCMLIRYLGRVFGGLVIYKGEKHERSTAPNNLGNRTNTDVRPADRTGTLNQRSDGAINIDSAFHA